MKQEGITMVNCGPVVLTAVENRVRIDVPVIVLAGVDDAAVAAAAYAPVEPHTAAAAVEPHTAAAPVEPHVAEA